MKYKAALVIPFLFVFSNNANEKNNVGFKPVLSFVLDKNQPLQLKQFHRTLHPLRQEEKPARLTFGFRQKNLFLYHLSFNDISQNARDYITNFDSQEIKQQTYYILNESPQVYCQIVASTLSCANDFSAFQSTITIKGNNALIINRYLLYYLLSERFETKAATFQHGLKYLATQAKSLAGRWQKSETGYRLIFNIKDTNGLKLLRKTLKKNRLPKVDSLYLPEKTQTIAAWRQPRNEWYQFLRANGFEPALPKWLQQDLWLVRAATPNGSLYAYRMKNIGKVKRERIPRQQARQFFKKFRRGKYTIYRLAWRKKEVYTVFRGNYMYLVNNKKVLTNLIKNSLKVKAPTAYFYLQSVTTKGTAERADDIFFLKLLSQFSEVSLKVNEKLTTAIFDFTF